MRRHCCVRAAPTLALVAQQRSIRTQIPPRPSVTVLAYLDHHGNVVRGKEETDLSLVRTRDNKFYLQRVYPNETVVRFLCPGLSVLKNATNFEYFSMFDIDNHGGIVIPSDVFPTAAHDPPTFSDGVYCLTRCEQTTKFTRKDRRSWHRRLFSHWQESPEKYHMNFIVNTSCVVTLIVWLLARYIYVYKNGKTYFEDLPERDNTYVAKSKRFSDRHPEHIGFDLNPLQLSPGQHSLSQARSDMRNDWQDTTSWTNDGLWKIRHAFYYHHWPRSIND